MQTPAKKPWKAYGRYGSLGIELIVSMALGYYGGRWLDGRFGTRWIALVGFVVGVYAGFRQIFRAAKYMQAEAEREERDERERWHGGGALGTAPDVPGEQHHQQREEQRKERAISSGASSSASSEVAGGDRGNPA